MVKLKLTIASDVLKIDKNTINTTTTKTQQI